jgi:hypothetical protein
MFDKVLKIVYTLCNGGVCVEENRENDSNTTATAIKDRSKISSNDVLGFLYKTCKKIKPITISKIAHVREYMDALIQYDGYLDDATVYAVLRKTYFEVCESRTGFKLARDILKQVSKAVTGDPQSWRE